MKIDLAIVSYDKDAPSKGAGNADADRGAMGDAFGKAVRDAEGKRPAPAQDKPETGGKVAAPEDGEAKPTPVTEAIGETDAEADAPAATESDPLQSLLGALLAANAPKAGPKDAAETPAPAAKGEGDEARLAVDPKLAAAISTQELAATDKRSMQLDVVRMETHFEPRQDGMVLIEGASEPGKASGATTVDPKAKAASAGAEGLVSALADLAKPKTLDAGTKPVAEKTPPKDDGSLPPMRFDEALAQLGRGEGERSGRESGRDGSASAQSSLAELAARRSAAKGADAIALSGSASVADPLPSSSPYNLAAQVAGPIMDALGDPGQTPSQAPSASNDAHLRMRAGGGALKTLTIQLHPEHLGTVDVSLRLNEGRLTLELAASRADTASMLLDDQASLRKLLEQAGFSLDDAAISVITRDSGQVRTAESGAAGSPQRDASGHGGAGEGRSETRGQSGGSDERPAQRRAPSRSPDDTASAPSRSSATYL